MNDMVCRKCGWSFIRLALKALAQDAGAKAGRSAEICNDGGDHDFSEKEVSCPSTTAANATVSRASEPSVSGPPTTPAQRRTQ